MIPEPPMTAQLSMRAHVFELESVGAFSTSGQFGTAAFASLRYHMEEVSLLAALPWYSCTGFPLAFLPFLMFKLRVLLATGAILDGHVRSKCHQKDSKGFHHIPVSAGAVAQGDDTPADSAVHWRETGSCADTVFLGAIWRTSAHRQ